MGGSRAIPAELNGSTAAAVRDAHRQHHTDRHQAIVRWLDHRPELHTDDGHWPCWMYESASRLQGQGLTSAQVSSRLLAEDRARTSIRRLLIDDPVIAPHAGLYADMAWRWHTHGIDDDTILRGLRWRIETNADPHVDSKPKNRGGSTTPLHNPAEAVYRPVTGRSERMVNP